MGNVHGTDKEFIYTSVKAVIIYYERPFWPTF